MRHSHSQVFMLNPDFSHQPVAIMNEQQMFALNYWGKAVKYFLLAGVKVWNRERTDNKVMRMGHSVIQHLFYHQG